MGAYELLLLAHLLLFAYWLGGDVGVFYSSGFVVDGSRSREARLMAGKIMLACDLIPRICMSLMLTVGGLLAATLGFDHPAWQTVAIVLLAPVWFGMVMTLHFAHGASWVPALTRIDYAFRWLVIAAILASCAYALATGRLAGAPWLIAKLLGFAFLVFCGLMIRRKIPGFIAGYVKLVSDDPSAEENAAMQRSLGQVRPWVIAIWVVLVVEAAIGIAKPGAG